MRLFSSDEVGMDNPTIISNPIDVDDTFIFKGDFCIVKKLSSNGNGFWYHSQSLGKDCYMSFSFYTTTPSYKSKNK